MKSLEKCKCSFTNYGEAFPKGLVCRIHNPSKLVCFHCKKTIDNPGDLNLIGWGIMEFGDGWFPMCLQCKSIFEPENVMIHGWKADSPYTTYRGYRRSIWFKREVESRPKIEGIKQQESLSFKECMRYFDSDMINEITHKICGECEVDCPDCEAGDWCDEIQEILLNCAIEYMREQLWKSLDLDAP